jgi:predicted outer membrane repeat protein
MSGAMIDLLSNIRSRDDRPSFSPEDDQGRPAPEYAASPVLSVTWGDAHTRLRFSKNGAGDGGAITSHRISVTRLRYRLEMRSGLWRIIRCRQAKTGALLKLVRPETKTAPSSTTRSGPSSRYSIQC